MTYCQTHFHAVSLGQVEGLLSSFAKECFVAGQTAYQLDDGAFSIDAGENDIRAYYNENEETIKFICRYERDMKFYDKKLMAFATKYGINTINAN